MHPGVIGVIQQHSEKGNSILIIGKGAHQGLKPPHAFNLKFVPISETGFQLADQTEANFLVAYFTEYKRKLNSSSVSVGMGRGSYGRYGGVGYNTGVSEYDQSSLTIDMITPADDKTIW